MGYLQIDAHLDASVEIAGERETNCNGLVRAEELPNVSAENMAIIGIRGQINVREWWDEVRARDIRVYPMSEVLERGFAVDGPGGARPRLGRRRRRLRQLRHRLDRLGRRAGHDRPGAGRLHLTRDPPAREVDRRARAHRRGQRRALPVYDRSGITAKLVWSVIAEICSLTRSTISTDRPKSRIGRGGLCQRRGEEALHRVEWLLRGLLPSITTPTQVIAGRDDDLVPWSNNEYLAELLPNREIHPLDAGHFAWEQASDSTGGSSSIGSPAASSGSVAR